MRGPQAALSFAAPIRVLHPVERVPHAPLHSPLDYSPSPLEIDRLSNDWERSALSVGRLLCPVCTSHTQDPQTFQFVRIAVVAIATSMRQWTHHLNVSDLSRLFNH